MQPVAASPASSNGDAAYWAKPADELLSGLGSRPTGLSSVEAAARLRDAGPNVIGSKGRATAAGVFLRQFAARSC